MVVYRSTGSAIQVDFENTYEYQGHEFDSFDSLVGLLNFNLNSVRDLYTYDRDIETTLKTAVELAREMVNTTHPVNPYTHYRKTGGLADSIKYDMSTLGGGNGGRLYADARDYRGHKYAGHIEYGFTDRAGIPHGPWPFLRPAMRMALAATKYNFAKTMEQNMLGVFMEQNASIGKFNARQNIESHFGSLTNAAHVTSREYGSSYGGEGRWGIAENGIGFKSGVEWGNTVSSTSWSEGWL